MTWWSLGEYWLPWDIFGTIWKVFLRAFGGHLDHWNQSSIPRVIVQMKFMTLPFLLVWALLRSYLVFGKLWGYSCSFLPALCRFSSGSHVLSPWLYPFYLTRNLFFLYLCRKSRIFSTSHSFRPCIKVSGEGVDFCSWMVDLEYCANLLVWKTGCSTW